MVLIDPSSFLLRCVVRLVMTVNEVHLSKTLLDQIVKTARFDEEQLVTIEKGGNNLRSLCKL